MALKIDPLSHLGVFTAELGFELDDFQIEGCQAVEAGRGVLVCAPTGAGKTIVGEFAVSLALARGTKCFYTTPIKALSNQKFHDLVAIHGEEEVGLLTGDVSINGSADILVMTTEVLRNMLYADSPALERLGYVVMDEIHFLADRSRGAVWEEVILNLAEWVSVIGLSATVSNSEEFGEWMRTVRGDTDVIVTDSRPVPLDQWMLVGRRLFPLFEKGDGAEDPEVNRGLVEKITKLESRADTPAAPRSGSFRNRASSRGAPARSARRSGQTRSQDAYRPLARPEVLRVLQDHDMLPAITFIFSRAGCDGALYQCLRSKLVLTDEEEAQAIATAVDAGVADIPADDLEVLQFRRWKQALMRGFAAHHAGMLPAFRHIVEDLFSRGLLKAIFATETLALGINMPARTVVLEKLVKFDGEGHVDLTPGQYTQLTGRAGRRGIDTVGNAVVLWQPAMDPHRVAGLASTRTYPLNSTFEPGYNMSVNLLATQGYEAALTLIEQSFAQFQADGTVVEEVRSLQRAEKRLEEARTTLERSLEDVELDIPAAEAAQQLSDYAALRQRLSEEEKQAKRASLLDRFQEADATLRRLEVGEVIAVPGQKKPLLAVVIEKARFANNPAPLVLLESGWMGRIDSEAVGMAPERLGTMRLPRAIVHGKASKKQRSQLTGQLRHGGFARPKRMRVRTRPNKKVNALRAALTEHPAHRYPEREHLVAIAMESAKAQRRVDKLRTRIDTATDSLGKKFDRILGLLTELDYVELNPETREPVVAEEGEKLAHIHSESDLLVAQCLRRGIWDGLDPAELAGAASCASFENRKPGQGNPQAPTDALAAAIDGTMRVWDELVVDEKRHQLDQTAVPDAAFALAIHQWSAGAPLDYCLAAANECGAELTPGDFVRQVRQVADLLEQVRKTGYNEETKRAARQAIDAMRRGVVAVGT
ncbi:MULTISPECIES: RNA helicase [Corynebacterium]|uniref:DEAD/DEAH box helicase n=1 Tax=Corynebacterium TaxID=1716 RepID=UPI00124EAB18|nr:MULTISPECIES: DEAD/DEAH box helicase [Corynebacterium]